MIFLNKIKVTTCLLFQTLLLMLLFVVVVLVVVLVLLVFVCVCFVVLFLFCWEGVFFYVCQTAVCVCLLVGFIDYLTFRNQK